MSRRPPELSLPLSAAELEFSFMELSMPEHAEARRTTLARIRDGSLLAAVSVAVGGDLETLALFTEYQKDLKALLVALEQRDAYQLLYTQVLKERQQDEAGPKSRPQYCSRCPHCEAEFFGD